MQGAVREAIGREIPPIALGTVQFGMDYGLTKAKSQREVELILSWCVERGLYLLDTAPGYGDSEEKIGRFIRAHPGSDLLVETKIRRIQDPARLSQNDLERHIRDSVDRSRRRLGLETIPIVLLHQAEAGLIGRPDLWAVIRGLRETGAVGAFGVSVYGVEEARSLLEVGAGSVQVVQLPFSVFDQRFKEVASDLVRAGTSVFGRSVFLKGLAVCAQRDVPGFLEGLLPYRNRLAALASRLGMDSAELALTFSLRSPFISSTLIGVNGIAELETAWGSLGRKKEPWPSEDEFARLAIPDQSLIDPREWGSRGF